MKMKITILTLALGLCGAQQVFAHADHAPPKVLSQNPPKPADKETVAKAETAARGKIAEVAAKSGSKLGEAWKKADDISLIETLKVTYDIAPADWRLKFSNSKAADKKELYVFVSENGSRVLGLNFDGK